MRQTRCASSTLACGSSGPTVRWRPSEPGGGGWRGGSGQGGQGRGQPGWLRLHGCAAGLARRSPTVRAPAPTRQPAPAAACPPRWCVQYGLLPREEAEAWVLDQAQVRQGRAGGLGGPELPGLTVCCACSCMPLLSPSPHPPNPHPQRKGSKVSPVKAPAKRGSTAAPASKRKRAAAASEDEDAAFKPAKKPTAKKAEAGAKKPAAKKPAAAAAGNKPPPARDVAFADGGMGAAGGRGASGACARAAAGMGWRCLARAASLNCPQNPHPPTPGRRRQQQRQQ